MRFRNPFSRRDREPRSLIAPDGSLRVPDTAPRPQKVVVVEQRPRSHVLPWLLALAVGAAIAEAGRGHCDSCFEDMYGHQWLPPLSPIAGHVWLLSHTIAGDSWDEARLDAPWRRYTTLSLERPKSNYEAVRFDWWALDASKSNKRVVIVYLLFAGALVALGVALLRRREQEP